MFSVISLDFISIAVLLLFLLIHFLVFYFVVAFAFDCTAIFSLSTTPLLDMQCLKVRSIEKMPVYIILSIAPLRIVDAAQLHAIFHLYLAHTLGPFILGF